MSIKLKPLSEQVIIITGASSGIGLATALGAAQKGAKVVVAARSTDILDEVVAGISAAGGEALAVPTDVSVRAEVEALASATIARFGRIDTRVNDAGMGLYARLDEVSEKDARRLFDINVWGVINGSLVALPYLKANGGALINVGSEVSEAVVPLQGMYSVTKHAVKGYTDALRIEIENVDKAPVSITLIQPTAVDTPFPQNAKNYMTEEPKLPTPMIEPQQVANAILDAAENHRRDVKVGMGAHLDTFLANNLPSLGDSFAAKQIDRQTYDEVPRRPEGTLFQAGHSGRVKGTGGREKTKTKH